MAGIALVGSVDQHVDGILIFTCSTRSGTSSAVRCQSGAPFALVQRGAWARDGIRLSRHRSRRRPAPRMFQLRGLRRAHGAEGARPGDRPSRCRSLIVKESPPDGAVVPHRTPSRRTDPRRVAPPAFPSADDREHVLIAAVGERTSISSSISARSRLHAGRAARSRPADTRRASGRLMDARRPLAEEVRDVAHLSPRRLVDRSCQARHARR